MISIVDRLEEPKVYGLCFFRDEARRLLNRVTIDVYGRTLEQCYEAMDFDIARKNWSGNFAVDSVYFCKVLCDRIVDTKRFRFDSSLRLRDEERSYKALNKTKEGKLLIQQHYARFETMKSVIENGYRDIVEEWIDGEKEVPSLYRTQCGLKFWIEDFWYTAEDKSCSSFGFSSYQPQVARLLSLDLISIVDYWKASCFKRVIALTNELLMFNIKSNYRNEVPDVKRWKVHPPREQACQMYASYVRFGLEGILNSHAGPSPIAVYMLSSSFHVAREAQFAQYVGEKVVVKNDSVENAESLLADANDQETVLSVGSLVGILKYCNTNKKAARNTSFYSKFVLPYASVDIRPLKLWVVDIPPDGDILFGQFYGSKTPHQNNSPFGEYYFRRYFFKEYAKIKDPELTLDLYYTQESTLGIVYARPYHPTKNPPDIYGSKDMSPKDLEGQCDELTGYDLDSLLEKAQQPDMHLRYAILEREVALFFNSKSCYGVIFYLKQTNSSEISKKFVSLMENVAKSFATWPSGFWHNDRPEDLCRYVKRTKERK